jgi:hypothetical protein
LEFRLTRLILIDSYCRNRIAELDVRGHITINGENGAGKTTLLRLLPMFFGESPSRIIRGDAVTEKFGRYYFPTTASYLIFEYQRRNSMALAVIHADGQSDGVVYRFIDSEFRPELFKDGDVLVQTGALHRHLDKMGVFDSKPLSLHTYRQVIQNTAGREHKNLAGRFAFTGGTGKLTHIERIVTGIFQRATTFYDLKRMIVSSILDEEKGFSLRTSRKDLLHWVSEYEAHYAVMEKLPVMNDLEQLDQKRRLSEADFSRLHARFKLLHDHHQEQVVLAEKAEEAAKDDKKTTEKTYGDRLRELDDKKRSEESKATQAKNSLENISHRKDAFEKDGADGKVAKVNSLPQLNQELEPLEAQFAKLRDEAKSITVVFDEMESTAKELAGIEKSKLEVARGDAYQDATKDKEIREIAHRENLVAVQERHETERDAAADKVSKCKIEEARLLVEIQNALADPETLEALEQAREIQSDAIGILEKLHEATPGFQRAVEKLRVGFEELELQIANGEVAVEQAQEKLHLLLAANNAGEDTLLGFLRRNKPNWVSDIGRIVSEETLLRTDLSPVVGAGTDLYGIGIDLEKLTIGRFASEEALQDAIRFERSRLERRTKEVADDKKAREKKLVELTEARAKLSKHEATISIAKNAKATADQRVAITQKRVNDSKNAASAKAKEGLAICRTELGLADTAAKMLKVAHREEVSALSTAYNAQITAVNMALEARLESIRVRGQTLDASLRGKLAKIAADRDECLLKNGVSPEVRNRIEAQITSLKGRIQEANELRGYVTQYLDWLDNIWPKKPEYEQALTQAQSSTNTYARQQKELLAERHTVLELKDKIIADAGVLAERHYAIQRNAKHQMTALALWPLDTEMLASSYDSDITVEALSADRKRLQEGLDDCREKIRVGVEEIRCQMCKEIGTGPERFYSTALREMGYPSQGKEHEWIGVFRTWYGDRHSENRNSLLQLGKTMAQNISYFWKSLGDFKRNVTTFATDLKANLEQGRIFDSIADVTTEIKTHVDTQNYWDAVETLHHEYDAWHTLGEQALPPLSFVAAAKSVANVLSEENGLVADPVDLVSLKVSANVNGQGVKTASNEHELANMSSNGLSYIILCVILIGFVNRIRRKEPVVVPFVVDELKDLSYLNAKTLLELLERNNITMISAFPDVDLDLAELFGNNYKILKGREVGLIDLQNFDSDEEEEEVANV